MEIQIMTLFERIKSLANKRNKNMKEVALELGFSENLFYRWKKTEPKATDLAKVADYFNVSVDYLLGRKTEQNNQDISVDDIEKYRLIASNGKPISDKTRRIIVSILKEMEENDE